MAAALIDSMKHLSMVHQPGEENYLAWAMEIYEAFGRMTRALSCNGKRMHLLLSDTDDCAIVRGIESDFEICFTIRFPEDGLNPDWLMEQMSIKDRFRQEERGFSFKNSPLQFGLNATDFWPSVRITDYMGDAGGDATTFKYGLILGDQREAYPLSETESATFEADQQTLFGVLTLTPCETTHETIQYIDEEEYHSDNSPTIM